MVDGFIEIVLTSMWPDLRSQNSRHDIHVSILLSVGHFQPYSNILVAKTIVYFSEP